MIVCGIQYQWRNGPQTQTVVFKDGDEKTLVVISPRTRLPPSVYKWDTDVYREQDVHGNQTEIPCLLIRTGEKSYFFVLRESVWYQSSDINPYCTVMYMMEPNTLTILDS
jgi:hypothetical protein